MEYRRDNNFYYIPAKIRVPEPERLPAPRRPPPLGSLDSTRKPAKWTGNGARQGAARFQRLVRDGEGQLRRPSGRLRRTRWNCPEGFDKKTIKPITNSGRTRTRPTPGKIPRHRPLLDGNGVDGFRFDMAEMVPVEFWSFMNSAIKMKNPDAFLLGNLYPSIYRDYIHLGKMDYLYDKVELYDTLKHIMQVLWTDNLPPFKQVDIEHHLLHFLENHDEQRIASPDFAGTCRKGKPAMVVSRHHQHLPTMICTSGGGGRAGGGRARLWRPTRTSIFDYIGVPPPALDERGAFDGGQSTPKKRPARFLPPPAQLHDQQPTLMGNTGRYTVTTGSIRKDTTTGCSPLCAGRHPKSWSFCLTSMRRRRITLSWRFPGHYWNMGLVKGTMS